MKKISILIVDDEEDARNILKELLCDFSLFEVTGEAANARQAIEKAIILKPDLVLLDITMPGKNGIEVAADLRKLQLNPGIIFVTGFNEYAIEAFKVAAFDYLLKPIDPEELAQALHRFLQSRMINVPDNRLTKLTEYYDQLHKIKLFTRCGFIMVKPDQVFYFVADGSYTELHLANQKTEFLTENIGEVEKRLPGSKYFRISRQHIINLDYLESVNRREKTCLIEAGGVKLTLKISSDRLKLLELSL